MTETEVVKEIKDACRKADEPSASPDAALVANALMYVGIGIVRALFAIASKPGDGSR